MKRPLLLLILIAPLSLWAQEILSYQNKTERVEFSVSQDQYWVAFKKENKDAVLSKTEKFTSLSETTALVLLAKDERPFANRKTTVATQLNNRVERIEPVLLYHEGTRQLCQGQLILKLTSAMTLEELLKTWKYTAVKDEFVKNQYVVAIESVSTQQLFELVSALNQNKNVQFAEPNFTRLLKPHTSDTYYSSQWAINNQGYWGGTVGADMDVDGAWAYATGQGIKVAIIDDGVDLNHSDLTANLLTGYDATAMAQMEDLMCLLMMLTEPTVLA